MFKVKLKTKKSSEMLIFMISLEERVEAVSNPKEEKLKIRKMAVRRKLGRLI